MTVLHNRISQAELKERLEKETALRHTISFYQYFPVADPSKFRDELYCQLSKLNVFGRIYVAKEGINAQVSVLTSNFEQFREFLYSIEPLNGIRLNISVDNYGKSFWVLKIKVREKIVADGITNPGFSMVNKGRYVNAKEMNELLDNKNTLVIDMRNHYEYEVGHFEKAIEIPSDTFREQLPMAIEIIKDKKEKQIVMYCTGGIRCEKASAYMLYHGFKNVFHLEGGILNYVRQVKEEGLVSKFIGKNFVFDNRLGERITEDIIAQCHQCDHAADSHTNCKNDACHLLFIQCKACAEKFDGCCSITCQTVYKMPLAQQKELRKNTDNDQMIFHKAKSRLRPRLNKGN